MPNFMPPNPNYAQMISQAAQLPSTVAGQWGQAGVSQQQAQGLALQNQMTRMKMPLMQDLMQQWQAEQEQQRQQYNQPSQEQNTGGTFGTAVDEAQGPVPKNGGMPSPVNAPLQPGAGVMGTSPTSAATAASTGTQQPTRDQSAPELNDSNNDGSSDTTDLHSQRLAAHAGLLVQQKYQQLPEAPPQDVARRVALLQRMESLGLIGPGAAQAEMTQWEAKIKGENQRRTFMANNAYSIANDVVNSAHPRVAFNTLDPDEAKLLPKDMTDAQIVNYMTHAGNALFKYTGREIKVLDDGTQVDTRSGSPVVGAQKVDITQQQLDDLYKNARDEVPVPWINGTTRMMQRWQAAQYMGGQHFDSDTDMVNQTVSKTRALRGIGAKTPPSGIGAKTPPNGAPSGFEGVPTSAAQSPANAPSGTPTPAPVVGSPPQSHSETAPPPSATGTGRPSVASTTGPGSRRAFSPNFSGGKLDFSDAQPRPQLPNFVTPSDAQTNQVNQYESKANDVREGIGADAQAASSNNVRDQQILQRLNQAETGKAANTITALKNIWSEFTDNGARVGKMQQDAAASEVVNKLLNTGAFAGVSKDVREGGSGSARFSALLGQMSINQLSANLGLVKDAIRQMVRLDLAGNQYDIEKGKDFQEYDRQQKNVVQFPNYYSNGANRQQSAVVTKYLSRMDDRGNIVLREGNSPQGKVYSMSDGSIIPANQFNK